MDQVEPGVLHRPVLARLLDRVEDEVHPGVPGHVGRHLPPEPVPGADHRLHLVGRQAQGPAVVRVRQSVEGGRLFPVRLAHEGGAVEDPAVHGDLERPDPDPVVAVGEPERQRPDRLLRPRRGAVGRQADGHVRPDGEPAGLLELLVGPVSLDVRPPLADAGDPDRVVRPVDLHHSVQRLLLGDRPGRQELLGQPLRVLQHPGRLAVGPLDDLAAGRVGGVAGDARGLEGGGVEHLHLPGGVLPVEHDRAVRGGRVEVGPGRHPPLADAGDVHPREPDPLPGGDRGRLLPHPVLDLGDRAELDERVDRLTRGRRRRRGRGTRSARG